MSETPSGDRTETQQHDPERRFDIVVFGATGFVGKLTAAYLAAHAPAGTRWAIAGRNRGRLEEVRDQLAAANPALASMELLTADLADPQALRATVEQTRVLVTTIGPYLTYGEPLVKACAEAGTDYLDLTGEPEFVDAMYLGYHEQAVRTGARLVHACGFDSVPHDLGVLYTVRQLPDDVPITVRGAVRTDAAFSGGTVHSALTQASRLGSMRTTARRRRDAEAPVAGKLARITVAPGRMEELGTWLLPLPTIDAQIVRRSALARPEYGPAFTYGHYAAVKRLPVAAASVAAAALFGVAVQIPPIRTQLGKRMPQGEGPSPEKRQRSTFSVDFVADGGGCRVHTRVSGGDPGYDETAKMLGESALCLAFDENPVTAGQVTPAGAMGDRLIERLQAAGMRFETLRTVTDPA